MHAVDDHMGWYPQGDGKFFYGWNVENGRLFDNQERRWKSAIREICDELNPGIRLTAHQSILFTDLLESDRPKLEEMIRQHGLPLTEEFRWFVAGRWPALPCQPVDWRSRRASACCPS